MSSAFKPRGGESTNLSGGVTDTYEYDAFGNKINSTGTTPNNYLYRGEQFDPDLGMYYLRAWYYNPLSGRLLSADPLADEGQRRYEYADANPVDEMDPTGEAAIVEFLMLQFRGATPIPFPTLCSGSGGSQMSGYLPGCGGSGGGSQNGAVRDLGVPVDPRHRLAVGQIASIGR